MHHKWTLAFTTCLVGLAFASSAHAQDKANVVGEEAFRVSCAVCHGLTGQGDGEFADVLTIRPANLTTLTANNDGEFPFLEVFQIVDGRSVRAHGTSQMPIWGDYFKSRIGESAGPYGSELLARARIVALVDYVQTLQK